jgi:hypothetical protein
MVGDSSLSIYHDSTKMVVDHHAPISIHALKALEEYNTYKAMFRTVG